MQYRVMHEYRSLYYGFKAGAVIELDDETAAFLIRDSPGVIEPIASTRDVVAPQATRQVVAPTGRRGRTTARDE